MRVCVFVMRIQTAIVILRSTVTEKKKKLAYTEAKVYFSLLVYLPDMLFIKTFNLNVLTVKQMVAGDGCMLQKQNKTKIYRFSAEE